MKYLNRISINILFLLFLNLVLITPAQHYPDTLKIPVTLYDFHSDGSCPDFNPGTSSKDVKTGMVQDTLDSDGRPVHKSNGEYFSYYVANWFRSSEAGEQPVTDTMPTYNSDGTLSGLTEVTENLYINKKFYDTLIFIHDGNGIYKYNNDEFFPLDGIGFGNENTQTTGSGTVNDHNYSFTMMIEHDFTYKRNMAFNFCGDDDVWVFIDGHLVLDIGGIHTEKCKDFELNDFETELGLKEGSRYRLSFFFAERQATHSQVEITTNILTPVIDSLHLNISPNDTIYAGDSAVVFAQIFMNTSDTQIVYNNITWGFIDTNNLNDPDSTFTITGDGDSVLVTPTKAPTVLKVWASVVDSITHDTLRDTVLVWVLVGPPAMLVIEADTGGDPYDPDPVDTVTIGRTGTTTDAHAILRDKEGNYIGPSTNTNWSISDVLAANIRNGTTLLGEGIIERIANEATTGFIAEDATASGTQTLRDTSIVKILHPPYIDSLHLKISPNDTVFAGDSTMVIAEVFRDTSNSPVVFNNITWGFADTNGINNSDSTFHIISGGDSTLITPTKAPTVLKIWGSVVDSVTNNTLYDTVLVWVLVGPPVMLVIEADTASDPYDPDPVDTVTVDRTGTTTDAHAILRDKEGNYIGPSTNTNWNISDILAANIRNGNTLLGEGIIDRIANEATTGFRAEDATASSTKTLWDTSIVTILHPPYIDSLHLKISPNDTIFAGDSAMVIAEVFRDTSNSPVVFNNITWGFADTNGINNPDSTFHIISGGDSTLITPTKAPTVLKLWGSVVDSVTNDTLYDTVLVWVLVGPPEMLVIEADTGGDPYDPDPIDTVTIGRTGTTTDAHAILRDKEGNYIGPSTNTNWSISDVLAANIRNGTTLLGEGIIERIANEATTGFSAENATASGTKILRDTSIVTILHPPYIDSFHLKISPNDTVFAGDSTMVIAEVFRDTSNSPVVFNDIKWGFTDTKGINNSDSTFHIISGGDSTLITPTKAPTVLKIWGSVIDSVTNDTLYDTVLVWVLVGKPAMLVIEADIGGNPYDPDPVDTVIINRTGNKTDAHAILRDKEGNYIGPSTNTNWTIFDTSAATIMNGDTLLGEGILERVVNEAITGFSAEDLTYSLLDSSVVKIINLPYIDSLLLRVFPNDTVFAGDSALIIAQVFMDTSTQPVVFNDIIWRFKDLNNINDSISTFSITGGGDSVLLTPTKAPTVLKIWGSVFDTVNKIYLHDSVLVQVLVGPPAMLVIEADTGGNPYDPAPIDTVIINKSQTKNDVHAILRDKEGNYIGPSTNTNWTIFSGLVAKITSGNALLGEGILEKIANNGTTGFSAKDAATNLEDNSVLKILSYYYTDLKIIVKNPVDYSITSLNMNTNQDTTLYVQGKRSDNETWENVNADWFASQSIKTTSAPPKTANSWFVSPTDSGRGIIYANLNNLADTLITTINVGHATKISIDFITEPENRIAGEPIEALVSVKNDDNMLIPGTTPSKTTFSDLLPNIPVMKNVFTGAVMIPSIIHGQDTVAIKDFKDINLIFVDGKATVYFLLYYVPPSNINILHDIKVERNDSITNNITLSDHETTVLHPGPLAKITIDPGDTVVFNEGDSKQFSTTGVDLYGNSLGLVSSDWSLESPLPQKDIKNNPHFLYDPGFDKKAEGYLTANSTKNNTITDRVYIILTATKTKIVSALTQDITGNGYLDAIKIKFDKEIIIPQNSQPGLASVLYYYEKEIIEFTIKAIVPVNDTTKMEYYLKLEENRKHNVPQTDWLPVLNFNLQIQDVAEVNEYQCQDGAGPVIWKVEKYIQDIYDRTKDVVTVTISENFNNRDGSEFLTTGPVPQYVFNVWQFNAVNDTTEIKDALNKISSLRKEGNKIIFTMENGFDLTAQHYLNLNHIKGHVCDALLNLPNANNQKVRVAIKGNTGKITVGPNPIIPTKHMHEKLKYQPLQHFDPNLVYNWVKTHGGAMVSVNIKAFKEVDINILVFDGIGNLVYDKQGHINTEETFKNNINTDDLLPLCFYWNGINNHDMKTAPGVYRMIIHIKAPVERESQKVSITVAVGR